MESDRLLAHIRDGLEIPAKDKVKLTWLLSAPAILAQLSSVIMQYIDAAMVGRLGADGAAAVGLVASSTWLVWSICSAWVHGFAILTAQEIGKKDFVHAKQLMRQAYVTVLVLDGLISALFFMLSGRLPALLGGDPAIHEKASVYFAICMCGVPVRMLSRLTGSMLQVSGNMRVPGMLNSIACVLNVIFNYFLIFPSGTIAGIPHPGAGLGIAGAALGTMLADLVVACAMLYVLLKRTPLINDVVISEKKLLFSSDLKHSFILSWPIALEGVIVSGALVVSTLIVAPLGVVAIAANSFAITAESLCYMPAYGFSEAGMTLVGQSIGASREKMAKAFGKIDIGMGIVFVAIASTAMYLFAPQMMALLSPDSEVIALGTVILRIECFADCFYGVSIICSGIFRGAGDTFAPSFMYFGSLWLVRIPLSLVLVSRYGLVGVWIAMCSELIFRGAIFLIRFVKGSWLKGRLRYADR